MDTSDKINALSSELAEELLNLDKTVRFVEIYHQGTKFVKMREGLSSLLNPEETEQSINDAVLRWQTRAALSNKLGEPLYAMAEYKKIKRITIPFSKDGLILVSLDPTGYHEIILKEMIEIKKRYESSIQ